MAGDPVEKYLARHAEPEARLAAELDRHARPAYAGVCIVPARAETAEFLDGLAGAAGDGRLLAIVVVNGAADGTRGEREANARLLADARRRYGASAAWQGETAATLSRAGPMDLLLLDRAGPGRELPPRRGVGLARKIGHDLALALWRRGAIASAWQHAGDGDAAFSRGRFDEAARVASARAGVAAIVHPFLHEPAADPALDEATQFHEMWLRFRLQGLRWAGSPHAWQAIGSALTVNAAAYAAVRGFPAREAGEDFHLLDKLGKLGAVVHAGGEPVRIRARISGRVPFGTGAAVAKLLAARAAGEDWRLPHPRAYARLREALRLMEAAAAEAEPPRDPFAALDGGARAALHALGAPAAVARLLDGRTPPSRRARACHVWFDGLRTVRFLHEVRDREAPDLPWGRALAEGEALGMIPPGVAGAASASAAGAALRRAESEPWVAPGA